MNGIKLVKFAVAVIAAATFCVSTAPAMTVSWSAGTTVGVDLYNGQAAPLGDNLYLGTFGTMSSTAVAALGDSPSAVLGAMSVWGTGVIGDGGVAAGEFFEATGTAGRRVLQQPGVPDHS